MNVDSATLVYGAIINYKKDIEETCVLINETLKKSVFNRIKSGKYENIIEFKLYEMYGKEPSHRRMSPRLLVASEFDPIYRLIANVRNALDKTDDSKNANIGKAEVANLVDTFNQSIQQIDKEIKILQTRLVKPNPEKMEEVVDDRTMLIGDVYFRLRQLVVLFYNKKREIENSLEEKVKEFSKKMQNRLADEEDENKIRMLLNYFEEKKRGIAGEIKGETNEIEKIINRLMTDADEIGKKYNPSMGQLTNLTRKRIRKSYRDQEKQAAKLARAEKLAKEMEPEVSALERKIKGDDRGFFGRLLGKIGLEEQKYKK